MSQSNRKIMLWVPALFSLLVLSWAYALFYAPPDAQQGMVYKIIFLHVPAAACALAISSGGMLIASLFGLFRKNENALRANRAWVETGLLFTILTLATGSIWGKPTWGTWWTWDARLTTTLLLAILQIAFLILLESLPRGPQRVRIMSIVGIIIFIDVPIIYKSVELWRTLHQPASLIAERGRTMAPEMLTILIYCLATTAAINIAIWWLRWQNLKLKEQIDDATYASMRG